eukprot:TRINITY_DN247_c0_g1_i1.p1 TRINITY_DN247_c0_g1~~TRINITY_DN247_c0_g1_i1.p1  ORF type:complete len:234 (+),score=63.61 TRINITY_DN247_c0_g1_i1:310-1011(+)
MSGSREQIVEELQRLLCSIQSAFKHISSLKDRDSRFAQMDERTRKEHARMQELVDDLGWLGQQGRDKEARSIGGKVFQEWEEKVKDLELQRRHAMRQFERNCQMASEERRKLLLSNGSGGEVLLRRRSKEQSEREQAENITDRLERFQKLLGTEISKVQESLGVLDGDSSVLRETKSEHRTYHSAIMGAHRALDRIRRRDRTDRILISFGFVMFLLVVIYIFKRRVSAALWWS